MKPSSPHLPFLDGLRGVAILSVFLFHSLGSAFQIYELPWEGWFRSWPEDSSYLLFWPITLGRMGVAIFFALSGFCIHLSHRRSKESGFKVFFVRRFFRIYPPYLLVLCLLTLFSMLHLHGKNLLVPDEGLGMQFLSHLFLFHNFSPTWFYGVNGSFWSIAVEVQLYLLYPVLLGFANRWGWRKAVVVTGCIELGLRGIQAVLVGMNPEGGMPEWITGSPFYFWLDWTLGAALAEAYFKGSPLPHYKGAVILVLGLFMASHFFRPLYPFCFTLAAILTVLAMTNWLKNPDPAPDATRWGGWAMRQLQWLGVISYSVYLIHQPIVDRLPFLTEKVFPHHTFSPVAFFGICLCGGIPVLALSYLLYRWLELPSMALGKWVIKNIRTKGPGAVAE